MNYSSLTLYSVMRGQMEYLNARQGVLAQNVANVDTPGYIPQDLQAPDFTKMVDAAMQVVRMRVTNPMHLEGTQGRKLAFKEIDRKKTYETNFNKNRVVIEEELKKVADTQTQYQTVTSLYRKTSDMFRTAVGRPNG